MNSCLGAPHRVNLALLVKQYRFYVNASPLFNQTFQVSEAKTIEEMKTAMEPLTDYLANAGCLRQIKTISAKQQLIDDVLRFQVIDRTRTPFERFVCFSEIKTKQ